MVKPTRTQDDDAGPLTNPKNIPVPSEMFSKLREDQMREMRDSLTAAAERSTRTQDDDAGPLVNPKDIPAPGRGR